MRRFSKLEFGDKSNGQGRPASHGEPVRTAEYFAEEALRYWLAGDFELALRNYSRSLEQNSAFYSGWLGQVLMLIELGEYREAEVWADKALELFPEHPELFAAKAIACARDGKMDKAIAYSDNSIARDNVSPLVWLARAEVLLNRQSRIGENCISKAIATVTKDAPIIRLAASRLLNRDGNYRAALEYLRAAADNLPKSALVWYELGCCQSALGRPEAAVTLRQCLKLRPGWEMAEDALRKCETKGFWRRLLGK
jgi:tetratricopeptide (TPR) repeat protein